LGYYDDHAEGRYQSKRKKSGYFLAGLTGAILGAFLVIVALPSLTHHDVIPESQTTNNATANTASNTSNVIQKQVTVDVNTDLAVITVDGSKVKQVAEFGDSDRLKVGEPVIAIGNPLGPTFCSTGRVKGIGCDC
jgi:S1-C subfamily serine protease